jgi:hypothetical protein
MPPKKPSQKQKQMVVQDAKQKQSINIHIGDKGKKVRRRRRKTVRRMVQPPVVIPSIQSAAPPTFESRAYMDGAKFSSITPKNELAEPIPSPAVVHQPKTEQEIMREKRLERFEIPDDISTLSLSTGLADPIRLSDSFSYQPSAPSMSSYKEPTPEPYMFNEPNKEIGSLVGTPEPAVNMTAPSGYSRRTPKEMTEARMMEMEDKPKKKRGPYKPRLVKKSSMATSESEPWYESGFVKPKK